MKNYKQVLVLLMLGFVLSCTSSKKIEQDDDFATDTSAGTAVSADPAATSSETSEFDLNEPAVAATPTDVPTDAATAAGKKDEFADFDDPNATPAPAPSDAVAKDEFADFDQPTASPAPEVATEATPVPVAPETVAVVPEPTPTPAPEVAAEVPKIEEKPAEELARINAVSYQANQNGGAVSIVADHPLQFTTRLNSTTNQLVVEIQNAIIPKKLKRSLNTKDMASSIGSVDIYQKEDSKVARFVIQLRPGSAEPLVQPEGNSLIVIGAANEAFVAKQKAAAEAKAPEQADGFTDLASDGLMGSQSLEEFLVGNQKYYGKKISIETNNLDVKEAIKFIAEESGTNLLMDEGLEGRVSLKLRQVPWDQALVLILKAKKLGYVRQGNVLRIAKLSDLQNEELEAYKLLENRRSNEPLVVKRFFISYAKLTDLEGKIREFISATAQVNNASLIGAGRSPGANGAVAGAGNVPPPAQRGRVISDERTGSLIVTDTPDNLSKIEKLIAALDTQPKQIVVESRIISASESFTRTLGVQWTTSGASAASSPNSVKLGINNLQAGVLDSTFSWGNLDVIGNLDARIALGELQNKVRVLNTQRTTVISGQSSKIEARGKLNIPITQVNAASQTPIGTSGFQTIEYGLSGEITPQASNENTVSASITLSQTKIDDAKSGSTSTDGIGGKVVAKNGQTVVVQANFQSTNITDESGVPGLKDIPVLGLLFKGKSDIIKKAETMLFTTMYILEPVSGTVKKATNDNTGLDLQ